MPSTAVVMATFGEAHGVPRLSDCSRGRGRGGFSCADCYLEATLSVYVADETESTCERRRFMELVMVPATSEGFFIDELVGVGWETT